jgi:hypothetical protein
MKRSEPSHTSSTGPWKVHRRPVTAPTQRKTVPWLALIGALVSILGAGLALKSCSVTRDQNEVSARESLVGLVSDAAKLNAAYGADASRANREANVAQSLADAAQGLVLIRHELHDRAPAVAEYTLAQGFLHAEDYGDALTLYDLAARGAPGPYRVSSLRGKAQVSYILAASHPGYLRQAREAVEQAKKGYDGDRYQTPYVINRDVAVTDLFDVGAQRPFSCARADGDIAEADRLGAADRRIAAYFQSRRGGYSRERYVLRVVTGRCCKPGAAQQLAARRCSALSDRLLTAAPTRAGG